MENQNLLSERLHVGFLPGLELELSMLTVQAEHYTIHSHHFLAKYSPHLPELPGSEDSGQAQNTIQIDSSKQEGTKKPGSQAV